MGEVVIGDRVKFIEHSSVSTPIVLEHALSAME